MNTLMWTAAVVALVMPLASFAQRDTYEPAVVTLQGTLLSAPGETPDGKKMMFPAIQLSTPITVQGDQETPPEKGVVLMHVVLNPKIMEAFKKLKGTSVSVTGSLFHADNGNHQTNVLITPSAITPIE
jgi:hypothetical protein